MTVAGKIDIKKTIEYIFDKQEVIREHENAFWLKEQGVELALGNALFTGKNEIEVNGIKYTEIVAKTKLSSRTIARISDWLQNGCNGYQVALQNIHHDHISPARAT